jgi:biofilm PGA synthesis N-glycosyltransferase PgaC
VAGGFLFSALDEYSEAKVPAGGWPGVTVLISAYNEEAVIETSVRAALASDYPELELIVLDDGSTDATTPVARAAGSGDPRLEVVRGDVNKGKAAQLNHGFARARHELVVVTDADTHLHPMALRPLVARIARSPRIAAVAGGPHVTNRGRLLPAMQTLEAASIIGLIRRTQGLIGRVGTVAGVLALFRRDAVLGVGGFDGRMATEDIDLSWRLLLAGWQTDYEPNALVGMEVPTTLTALWAQRRRWARGQGEVLRTHLGAVGRWRNRSMWSLAFEAVGSLVWVVLATLAFTLAVIDLLTDSDIPYVRLGLAWGVAISVVATFQLAFAIGVERRYDPTALRAFLLGPLYPFGYWAISAAAAIRSELVALIRGPAGEHVEWDQPREQLPDPERFSE